MTVTVGKKNRIIIGLAFMVFAIVGLVISLAESTPKDNYIETTGTIVEHYNSHNSYDYSTTRISYVVDGVTYYYTFNYYSSFDKVGKEVTIYYDPDNYNEAMLSIEDNGMIYVAIFFLVVGIILFVSEISRRIKEKNNVSSGIKEDRKTIEVDNDEAFNDNNDFIYHLTFKPKGIGASYVIETNSSEVVYEIKQGITNITLINNKKGTKETLKVKTNIDIDYGSSVTRNGVFDMLINDMNYIDYLKTLGITIKCSSDYKSKFNVYLGSELIARYTPSSNKAFDKLEKYIGSVPNFYGAYNIDYNLESLDKFAIVGYVLSKANIFE